MKSWKRTALIACVLAGPVFISGNSAAQKSKDTLRYGVNEPFQSLSFYYYPSTEGSFIIRRVYESLVELDDIKKEYAPGLAKSWARVDDKTIDFELYDDIVFHSGNKLTADDVIYTIDFTGDPKFKFPFKERYTWIDKAEKLGAYKLRVRAKELFADDMLHFAMRAAIVDSKLHSSYEDRAEYGRRTPVGTGPYRIANFDRNKGVSLARYDGVKKRDTARAPISKIEAVFVPDEQTRIAHLLSGGLDLLFNVTADNAREIKAHPNFDTTAIDSLTAVYLGLDVAGRSGHKAMNDPRVRKALFMAVDRDAIIKNVIPGGHVATKLDALCFDSMLACDYSAKPVAFNPAGAKKLLAEAGYPDGFDLTVDTHLTVRPVGEAIVGYLRAVGVKANLNQVTTPIIRKKRADGDMAAQVMYGPAGNWPEANYNLDTLFGNPGQDFVRDAQLLKAMEVAESTHDIAKRKAAYRIAFDRMQELSSHLPISSVPVEWAHTREVRILPNPLTATRTYISDVAWN